MPMDFRKWRFESVSGAFAVSAGVGSVVEDVDRGAAESLEPPIQRARLARISTPKQTPGVKAEESPVSTYPPSG
jgi:hypothetical protein